MSMQDITLTGEWVNIYAASGYAAQSAISIVNKTNSYVFLFEGGSTAPTSKTAGYPIAMMEGASVAAGTTYIWVCGTGPVLVQS